MKRVHGVDEMMKRRIIREIWEIVEMNRLKIKEVTRVFISLQEDYTIICKYYARYYFKKKKDLSNQICLTCNDIRYTYWMYL